MIQEISCESQITCSARGHEWRSVEFEVVIYVHAAVEQYAEDGDRAGITGCIDQGIVYEPGIQLKTLGETEGHDGRVSRFGGENGHLGKKRFLR